MKEGREQNMVRNEEEAGRGREEKGTGAVKGGS